MHQRSTTPPRAIEPGDAIKLVLGMARRLHKAAMSDSLSQSLPVLRRVLATDTLRGISLPELQRNRTTVQRKHILRTLAAEAGYPSWESYREALSGMTASELEHFDMLRQGIGYPNHWFSSFSEASEYAAACGGRAIRVGSQGVVVESV